MTSGTTPSTERRFDRRAFLALLAAGLVGVLAVLPYQFSLTGWPAAAVLPLVVVAALVQNAILVGLAVLVGLVLGPRVGLRVSRPASIPGDSAVAKYGRAALVGVAVGVVIVGLDALVFAPLVGNAVLGGAVIAAPQARGATAAFGLLASLYGGVTEELLLRFGLLTLLAWLGWRLLGRPAELPDGVAWAAILVAAVLFGLGHLPVTATLFQLTPAVLARMLVLNGLGGVVFGWLYWRYDLVSAMVAHFAGDVVLHVLVVLLV